jgi:hypothetical protein
MHYLESLGLTLVVEVPMYALALWARLEVRPRSGTIAGAGVNLISHPVGFLALQPALLGGLGYDRSLAVVELWAWIGEAALLFGWLRREPWTLLGISLLANALSFAVGLLLFNGSA